MDFPCESEINVRNENALRFSILSKPAPILEYLKTIASLIGASHILGIFENEDYIKVYFDDKKYVDTLIRSGIHVLGHHIKVDYVVPPASKVILSNVDPVVSNYDLIRLMSMFGSVVSPVFRSPISDDAELCHIDCGVRYVYIDITTPVPETLEFKYGDQMCKINVKLDDSIMSPQIKKESMESSITESSPNAIAFHENSEAINIDDLEVTNPIVLSVQSAAEESNTEPQNGALVLSTDTNIARNLNLHKARHAKLIKASSRIKNRNKHNIKYKNRKGKRFVMSRKKDIEDATTTKESPKTPVSTPPSSSNFSSKLDCSLTPELDTEEGLMSNISENILEDHQLISFLDEVRCQRAPVELAKKYLGSNFDSSTLLRLIQQINAYKKKSDDVAVKVRMNRLINNLKNFLDNNQ